MGKLRRYNAYISVSCSGPEESSEMRSPVGMIRCRAGADLMYTTADADFLYKHFSTPNADTFPSDIHARLINPKRSDLFNAIEDVSKRMNLFAGKADWDGGCIHLIYAGHGRRGNGALVFYDGDLTSEDFLQGVAAHTKPGAHRRRVDIVLDSCFSGAFVTTMLASLFRSYSDTLFPCSLFSAALHDEYAWEYPRYGHGIWTASFFQQLKSPNLNANRFLLNAQILWRRFLNKVEHKQLYNGGVSYMTENKQHSFYFENGFFQVDGAGSFYLPDLEPIDAVELQRMLENARAQDAEKGTAVDAGKLHR